MPDRPNFLIVMTDQQRLDSLGCYGNSFVRTPHVDALARDAVRFERCCTPFPVCTPARASLWTGLYPHAHGIIDNVYGVDDAFHQAGGRRQTIFDWLKEAGYATGYFGKWHLGDGRPAWADAWQGYNSMGGHWEDGRQSFQGGRYKPHLETEACATFLKSQSGAGRPFIAVQSYYPPHDPYSAPAEFLALYRGTGIPFPAYYAAVSAVDACVGRLLATLEEAGLAESTVVAFLSDHGETFGFRDDSIHKHVCHDEAIRVPFMLRTPGLGQAGRVVQEPVGLQDLAPTLLDLAGMDMPPGLHGRTLAPLVAGKSGGETLNYIQNRTRLNGFTQRAIRTEGWKLVLSDGGPCSLFDLERDPEELFDIFGAPRDDDPHDRYRHFADQAARGRTLSRMLGEYAAGIGDDVGLALASAHSGEAPA